MPHGSIIDVIPAPAADVFWLLHDYNRRLEWDTLLQDAFLLDGVSSANIGVRSICKGKTLLGGIALETQYVTFSPPNVAAVKMLNQPPFFNTFAATIRHTDLGSGASRIEYVYNFTARPRWLQLFLHPVMKWAFNFETRKRLKALRRHFLSQSHDRSR